MNRVAWLTCALLALAQARIYDRCELARDLISLGVDPNNIATWVCIAYHESRFDTGANNAYSGDHGIFQISELYWCGPGKACGLPCSALRDADISDDMQCALQVHEEHTRLQGNGFLAWVVYPQHCKHNTKKYLVDCDIHVKSPLSKSRGYAYEERYLPNLNYSAHNMDEMLPSYLAIGNILKGSYGKVSDQSKGRVDWYNYKLDYVDDLKLPSIIKPPQLVTEPPTTTTTTTTQTTTTYYPPVVPWRRIETNQFRKKPVLNTKSATAKEFSSITLNHLENSRPSTTYQTPSTSTTTERPAIVTSSYVSKYTAIKTSPTTSTTYKPPTSAIVVTRSPVSSTKLETIGYRRSTTPIPFVFTTSTSKPITSIDKRTTAYSTTEWPFRSTTKSRTWPALTWPTTVRANTARTTSRPTYAWWSTTKSTPIRPATTKIPAFSWTAARLGTTRLIASSPSTAKPTTRLSTTASPKTSSTHKWYAADTYPLTSTKLKTDISWYTFTPRTATTAPTTKRQSAFETTTNRPISYSTTTSRLQTTTQKPKTTQSIFDLYLHPTKQPKYEFIKFDSLPESKFNLKIFASGTTTPAPLKQSTTRKSGENSRDDSKN